MTRIPKPEAESRKLAQAKIVETGEWFHYINPPNNLIVHIKRALIPLFADAAKISEFEALPEFGEIVRRHRRKFGNMELGQSEELLTKPLKAAWHILRMDREYWISDEEFFPYF